MTKQKKSSVLYKRIRDILEAAQKGVARTVNSTQVVANWLIGREIVEEEQRGEAKAGYGEALLADLAKRLTNDFGSGYSQTNLRWFRQFYYEYRCLISKEIYHASRDGFHSLLIANGSGIHHAVRDELPKIPNPARAQSQIRHAMRGEFPDWKPGQLHPNLSWTHYRTLLRVEKINARSFYEIEAIQNNWSARELERQINSLLHERLAISRDKKGLLKLARKGQEIEGPLDVFKDPLVLEFLKIPPTRKLVESKLEEALLNDLQTFLLELGKGFAFLARQERITVDGDHFYIDLVFYHTVLKCYILLDLKVGKLTHQDLGQLELYVNYYDQERLTAGDNPTLGLILCTDKNDAVVRYTLGPDKAKKIFASRYKLHLPTESQLRAEVLREVRKLASSSAGTVATRKTRK